MCRMRHLPPKLCAILSFQHSHKLYFPDELLISLISSLSGDSPPVIVNTIWIIPLKSAQQCYNVFINRECSLRIKQGPGDCSAEFWRLICPVNHLYTWNFPFLPSGNTKNDNKLYEYILSCQ